MRLFKDCLEAVKEIERDLFEMGTIVTVESMQDKIDKFETLELRTYAYTIIDPTRKIIEVMQYLNLNKDYITKEFNDRIGLEKVNPGKSWLCRKKEWEPYLHDGKFEYTYSERISHQLMEVADILEFDANSRQGIVQIYDYNKDGDNRTGIARVPCSMYYQYMIRNNKVNGIYTMRSCDFLRHFGYDLILGIYLTNYLVVILQAHGHFEYSLGDFTHFIGSLHAYKNDLDKKGIF